MHLLILDSNYDRCVIASYWDLDFFLESPDLGEFLRLKPPAFLQVGRSLLELAAKVLSLARRGNFFNDLGSYVVGRPSNRRTGAKPRR